MRLIPRLHVLADLGAAAHPRFEQVLDQLSSNQNAALHLRDRAAGGRALAELGTRISAAGVICIINDRIDVALSCRAHGVHLPARGLPVDATRAMVQGRLIGKSCHSPEETEKALRAGADYVFLGPVWSTPTHPERPGLGVDVSGDWSGRPVIAIGGVTTDRVGKSLAAGFWGVAVISAVWRAENPAAATRALQVLLKR